MAASPHAPRAPKILVCDDEPVLRTLVRAALEPGGYAIVEAVDGEESLRLARSERPDLIVLDVMMPALSGLDVLRELRAEAAFEDVPVVMLTARARATDRAAALEAGATRYLSKPFSPLELAAVVEALLSGPGTSGTSPS